MLVSVIVPAYNEARTIERIIRKVHAVPLDKEIIVVDDGSSDTTADEVQALMRELPGVYLLRFKRNHGKGYAIRRALKHVRGDIVITQDADGEYDPSVFPRLVEPILKNEADVVYGSRNLKPNPRSYNRYYWGGVFLSRLINFLYGTNLTDEATGHKLFRTEVLKDVRLRQPGFAFCPEVTCKLLQKGISIKELPIDYTPRSMEEGKKIRWWHGIEAVAVILAITFRRA